jgi:hypothetical protein
METIIQAIDKAVRAGVYTLEETSIILRELDGLQRTSAELKQMKEDQEKQEKNSHPKQNPLVKKTK